MKICTTEMARWTGSVSTKLRVQALGQFDVMLAQLTRIARHHTVANVVTGA